MKTPEVLMRVLLMVALLLPAVPASAKENGFGIHAIVGLGRELEADKLKCKKGCQGEVDLTDEDFEGNFGGAVTYEVPMNARFNLGGRFAFMVGEGDDSEAKHKDFDLGVYGRFLIPLSSFRLFLHGAVGPTYVMAEQDIQALNQEFEFSGIGYHILVGGGFDVEVSTDVRLIGSLSYLHQAVGEITGEEGSTEIEIEDGTISGFVLMAGVGF